MSYIVSISLEILEQMLRRGEHVNYIVQRGPAADAHIVGVAPDPRDHRVIQVHYDTEVDEVVLVAAVDEVHMHKDEAVARAVGMAG